MDITVGTFNLNNLFSRFNFELQATLDNLPEGTVELEQIRKIVGELDEPSIEYKGIAMHRKDPKARQAIVDRIRAINVDVLAVQEIEDIDTLRYFAKTELGGMYPYVILIEGNDRRLIDVGVLSKYPIGAVTTWQHAVHSSRPGERIFSRDLLQVAILKPTSREHLFTLFTTHLKSHFVPFTEDQVAGQKAANKTRLLQAETMARIIAAQMRGQSNFVILGDMNDPIDSPYLAPFVMHPKLLPVDGLANPVETRPTPNTNPPPSTTAWTHRFKESGKPAEYSLFDHVWLGPELAARQTGAHIDRRTKLGGDGSDHDPAWVTLHF